MSLELLAPFSSTSTTIIKNHLHDPSLTVVIFGVPISVLRQKDLNFSARHQLQACVEYRRRSPEKIRRSVLRF